ncbi:MAG: redoxin domain-containing protein [Dehalococcoidales bacterium]|nr:redoxin domain-containing protein [Dehalococcoidales bacterium]
MEVSLKRLIAIGSLGVFLLLIASCAKTPPANPAPGGSTNLPTGNQTAPATQAVAQAKPGVGDPAPDLQLTDMTGKTVSLADYKGQIVWLNFWASW